MKRTIIIVASIVWLGLAVSLGLVYLLADLRAFLGIVLNYLTLGFILFTVVLVSSFLVIFYLFEVGEAKDLPFFSQNLGFESRHVKPQREVLTDLERAEYNVNKAKIQPRNVLKENVIQPKMDLSKEPKIDPIKELLASKKKGPTKVIEPGTSKPSKVIKQEVAQVSKTKTKDLSLEVSAYEADLIKEITKDENMKKIQKKMADEKLFNVNLFGKFKVSLDSSWKPIIGKEVESERFKKLMNKLEKEYKSKKVYPAKEDIFKALELTEFENIKVVIIGKIPFYRLDQADGLAFSTKLGSEINQTSQIIINEAIKDVDILRPDNASLKAWAKQGVLLLNSSLTALSSTPASHLKDWQWFTNKIIDSIIKSKELKVFVLWGEHGESFINKLKNTKHFVIKAPNPSPLSAANGFYGSQPFSKINKFLAKNGNDPIDWNL